MKTVKRRYQRVYIDKPASILFKELVLLQDHTAQVLVYQLGAMGCGIFTSDKTFQPNQGIYLCFAGTTRESPGLNIKARIVWKELTPDKLGCRYGLEFLWIRLEPGQTTEDPMIYELNHHLKPTGNLLMQAA